MLICSQTGPKVAASFSCRRFVIVLRLALGWRQTESAHCVRRASSMPRAERAARVAAKR